MENKNPLERKHEIICFMFCNSLVFNRFLDFCENLGNFRRILLITWLKKSDFSCLLVYFGYTFFYENIVGKSGEPSLLQNGNSRSAKSDVSKVLFPSIGKITNPLFWTSNVAYTTIYLVGHVWSCSFVSNSYTMAYYIYTAYHCAFWSKK